MKKFTEIKTLVAGSVRMLMHDALFLVCMAMSIGMFITFGNSWWTAGIMGLVAMVFESTKLYSLLRAKKAAEGNVKEKKWFSLFLYSTLYTVFAVLSFTASVMFALTLLSAKDSISNVVENQVVAEVEDYQENVDYWKSEMERITAELNTLTEAIDRADGNYGTSITKISSNKPALEASLAEAQEKWLAAKEDKKAYNAELSNSTVVEVSLNPSNGFSELANAINMLAKGEIITTRALMTIIFVLIMFLLEVSVAVTSGHLPADPEKEVTEDDLDLINAKEEIGSYYIKVIDAMFEGITGDRVNSVNKIAELTGYSTATVWKIRQSILTMSYKGKKILISAQGGTRAGLGKENMKKVVNFLLENPTDDILIPELP